MIKLLLKNSVRPKSLVIAAAIINTAREMELDKFQMPDMVITSGNDSTHGPNSKHYTHEALDLRTKTFAVEATKLMFIRRLSARLGANYDVVYESPGQANEHLHIEYDPR